MKTSVLSPTKQTVWDSAGPEKVLVNATELSTFPQEI
jgi:hypothetical protein